MFIDAVRETMGDTGSTVCVGLDPHLSLLPPGVARTAEGIGDFLDRIVAETAEHACVYKPNSAFYEALGPDGAGLLQRTIARIHREGRPAILDAKRGDISSTAAAYARAAFDVLEADAITVVPYMGEDAVVPFLDAGGFTFLLALPSNPSARAIVDHGEPPIFERIAEMAVQLNATYPGQVGVVVGATQGDAVRRMDEVSGLLPWLVPGIGAQGGDAKVFFSNARRERIQLVNASRSIVFADDPGQAAEKLNAQIREAKGD
jgi:orotidine 5'-phosphate decarboxylase subfamily 2